MFAFVGILCYPLFKSKEECFMSEVDAEERKKQIQEISTRKVAEHNDLISSVAKMDKIPLKIFELAVSYIDTDNPPKDNTIFIKKRSIYLF